MASKVKIDSKYDDYEYPTTSPNVQSGHPGHTTPQQDAQIFQLRTQLEQAGYTERLDTLCMVSFMILVSMLNLFLKYNSSDSFALESSTSIRQSRCKLPQFGKCGFWLRKGFQVRRLRKMEKRLWC